jgi:hypothetical protein
MQSPATAVKSMPFTAVLLKFALPQPDPLATLLAAADDLGADEAATDDLGILEAATDDLGVLEAAAVDDVVPPLTGGQAKMILLTSAPEAVSCELTQPPLLLAPGTSEEAPSALSFNAQLAWLIFIDFHKIYPSCSFTVRYTTTAISIDGTPLSDK